MREILSDKSYRTYGYTSRYASFPVYFHTIDSKYVYGTTSQLSDNVDYVLHTVSRGETYDSISLFYYNSPLYYWVVTDFNKIQDSIEPPKEGVKLKIPTLSSVVYEEV